jgi:peptide/nickel transport system substrate-binding protein
MFYEPSLDRQFEMFNNAEVDLLLRIPFTEYQNIQTFTNVNVIDVESYIVMYLALDTVSNVPPGINLSTNPLKDKRVRQAIAYSLNVRYFINERLYGRGNTLAIPALRELKGYPTHLDCYRYDKQLAKSLMKEAGYADGFEMRLRVVDSKYSISLAEHIQNTLKDINIDVIIDSRSANDFYQSFQTSPASAYIGSYRSTSNNIVNCMRNLFYHSSTNTGIFNRMKNHHPKVNTLIDSLSALHPDDRRFSPIARRLTDVIHDEVMVIPIFQPYDLVVYHKGFHFSYSDNILFSEFRRARGK